MIKHAVPGFSFPFFFSLYKYNFVSYRRFSRRSEFNNQYIIISSINLIN